VKILRGIHQTWKFWLGPYFDGGLYSGFKHHVPVEIDLYIDTLNSLFVQDVSFKGHSWMGVDIHPLSTGYYDSWNSCLSMENLVLPGVSMLAGSDKDGYEGPKVVC
jgi:hypothetical protein